MQRKLKKEIKIGTVTIGGSNKIAVQSMCQTKASNTDSCIKEIKRLKRAGADIVRIAVTDRADVEAIKTIKSKIAVPLVADVHFDYRLALAAVNAGVDKLRINPGNIGSAEHIREIVSLCKEKHIPIRIGVNMGSLAKEIEAEYGRTAEALVESAKKDVLLLESLGFTDIVLSLKASDVATTVKANELASSIFPYPLHIGITEAGSSFSGAIKTAVGIGILLNEGIGDTIRVSLTGDHVQEVKVAREILASLNLLSKPILISCPGCGRMQWEMGAAAKKIASFLHKYPHYPLKVAVMGCAVNGPGEAKDADIGVAGGRDAVLLFKKGKLIRKIKKENVVAELEKEIKLMSKNNPQS